MTEKDVFRDTWVRYIGYTNEVGESFRFLVPVSVVRASYAAAFSYVLADTTHKSLKMIKEDARPKKVAVAAGDALIWQTFASVVIPGYIINRLCAGTKHVVTTLRSPPMFAKCVTAAVGLASIPIIVHPIDSFVTLIMDYTYRRWADTMVDTNVDTKVDD